MNDQQLRIPQSLIRIAIYMLAPWLVKWGVDQAQSQELATGIVTAIAGVVSVIVTLKWTVADKKRLRDTPQPTNTR